MKKRKIIIDTDIGDDIDDAFALALAAAMPETELVGVTTVFRNTKMRAQLAQKLLETAGRTDVPVFAGERLPYKEPFHVFEKDEGLPPEDARPCQWEESYGRFPVQEGAVEFLAEAVKRYKEELTIVAIGPLTNLARAIEKYPAAMRKTGSVVTMGGSFQKYASEWNILCDPEAAQIVYASGIPLYAVGLDVTLQCALENDLLENFRSSAKQTNKLLSLWLERWFSFFGFEKSVMHDPLAAASLLKGVCAFRREYVRVELIENRGAIAVSKTAREGFSPVYAAKSVDRERFYSIVRRRLLGGEQTTVQTGEEPEKIWFGGKI